MAKKWSEVTASPQYQSLNPQQKVDAQNQYFSTVVAPQVPPDDVETAKSQFFSQYSTASTDFNTGNIRDESGKGFKTYNSSQEGIADQQRLLQSYQDKHGLNTIADIANRWAPPSENDTASYTKNIAQLAGFMPHEKLDLHDPETLGRLSYAQAIMEKGHNKVYMNRDQFIDIAKGGTGYQQPPQGPQNAPQEQPESNPYQPQPEQPNAPQSDTGAITDANQPGQAQPEPQGILDQAWQSLKDVGSAAWGAEKALTLGWLGTRDKASLTNPLGYLSPWANKEALTPEELQAGQAAQGLIKTGIAGGAFAAAAPLGAGVAEGLGLGAMGESVAGSAVGSVASQLADKQKVDLGQIGSDVALGEAFRVGGNLVSAGNAARRATMTAARAKEAAREARIGQLAEDTHAIQQAAPDLHGVSPADIAQNPSLADSFRKPGETAIVPERLRTSLKGIYGNEAGERMAQAMEQGSAPVAANPDWQPALDARWSQPLDESLTSRATRRLENEFNGLEKSRPAISASRLDELNQAYQSGSKTGANIPILGNLLNPSIRLSNLPANTLDQLGVGKAGKFGLAVGEGLENSLFGLGQVTRKSNQAALTKAAYGAENEAGTMAARKVEGATLARDDLDAMQQAHQQLADTHQPVIDSYQAQLDRAQELTKDLQAPNIQPADYLAKVQELNNVSVALKQLQPQAQQAADIVKASQDALEKQAAKVKEFGGLANSYKNAAKSGDAYTSIRNQTNTGAKRLLESEQAAGGKVTRDYSTGQLYEQKTPRQIMENKEETRFLSDNQNNFSNKAESKLVHWLHFVTKGSTLPAHLAAVGYSRAQAKAIMNDLARTGGKTLTGDQLRDVLGAVIKSKFATGAYSKSKQK